MNFKRTVSKNPTCPQKNKKQKSDVFIDDSLKGFRVFILLLQLLIPADYQFNLFRLHNGSENENTKNRKLNQARTYLEMEKNRTVICFT